MSEPKIVRLLNQTMLEVASELLKPIQETKHYLSAKLIILEDISPQTLSHKTNYFIRDYHIEYILDDVSGECGMASFIDEYHDVLFTVLYEYDGKRVNAWFKDDDDTVGVYK